MHLQYLHPLRPGHPCAPVPHPLGLLNPNNSTSCFSERNVIPYNGTRMGRWRWVWAIVCLRHNASEALCIYRISTPLGQGTPADSAIPTRPPQSQQTYLVLRTEDRHTIQQFARRSLAVGVGHRMPEASCIYKSSIPLGQGNPAHYCNTHSAS